MEINKAQLEHPPSSACPARATININVTARGWVFASPGRMKFKYFAVWRQERAVMGNCSVHRISPRYLHAKSVRCLLEMVSAVNPPSLSLKSESSSKLTASLDMLFAK